MMLNHKLWRPTPIVPNANVPNLLHPTGRADTAETQYPEKPSIASTVAQVDEKFPIHQHGDFYFMFYLI
jgi:hypothetical protein